MTVCLAIVIFCETSSVFSADWTATVRVLGHLRADKRVRGDLLWPEPGRQRPREVDEVDHRLHDRRRQQAWVVGRGLMGSRSVVGLEPIERVLDRRRGPSSSRACTRRQSGTRPRPRRACRSRSAARSRESGRATRPLIRSASCSGSICASSSFCRSRERVTSSNSCSVRSRPSFSAASIRPSTNFDFSSASAASRASMASVGRHSGEPPGSVRKRSVSS